MSRPWIVLGGGGHARVVLDTLRALGATVVGYTDASGGGNEVEGAPCLGDDDVLAAYPAGEVALANGLGAVADPAPRTALYDGLRARGYSFPPIVHPGALVAPSVSLSEGVQVMAGAVVQPGCRLGENSIVNTRASVDHDAEVGSHVHVAPGATLSGGVRLGAGAHVGVGATVLQGVRVGARAVVGAGAVVLRDVPDLMTVVGIPAHPLKR